METNINLSLYIAQFFLDWGMFPTKIVDKIKTQNIMPDNPFFLKRAFYEMKWKNIADSGRPHLTISRMRIEMLYS